MNTKTLMMIAGGGLVLYYLMGNKTTPATTGTGPVTGAGTQPGNSPPVGGSASNPGSGASGAGTPPATLTLAAIFELLKKRAAAGGVDINVGIGPDGWNWYLADVMKSPAPDPNVAFPNVDRSQPMPINTYWAGVSAVLARGGMSGLGTYWPRSQYFHGGVGGWLA